MMIHSHIEHLCTTGEIKSRKTNLAPGSRRSLTRTLSLSVMCLQRSSRENMYGDRVWDNDTKSMSDIMLFLRASSSCIKLIYLVGRTIQQNKTTLWLRRSNYYTVSVCSTFATSASRRLSSMKGNFAIP